MPTVKAPRSGRSSDETFCGVAAAAELLGDAWTLLIVRDLLAERRVDVSARTILAWAHKFGPLLATEGRRRARSVGVRRYCDETDVRVAGRWAYLYRAVDEAGQVVDVLSRAQRDLASACAFFDRASSRRGTCPKTVITDRHASYRRAVRRRTWRARHIRTGLHRARGETTKPIERSHVPIEDRLRPMPGLQSIATGQRLLEGIEFAHTIRRGHLRASTVSGSGGRSLSPHDRARETADTFTRLAGSLTYAA